MFLEKGYGGTRIDDIAEAAGVARSKFYTYLPSKRDVLLAAGAESAREAAVAVDRLESVASASWDDVRAGVTAWFDFLDVHGRFLLVWGQASSNDDELGRFGLRTQLRTARKLGESLVRWGHKAPVEATSDALALLCAMERLWYYESIASGAIDRDEIIDSACRLCWQACRPNRSAFAELRRTT